jgi:hypothetical protein
MDDVLDILSERIPNPSQGDMVSRILPKVIDKFDRVYVVVDELDQMTENRRRLYSSLLGLRNENLRLFLTTCHSPDEKSRLHKDPQILISGANVRKDLDTYVTKRLTDLPKFISYRPIVERRVKKRVMEDANELWVVMYELRVCLTSFQDTCRKTSDGRTYEYERRKHRT